MKKWLVTLVSIFLLIGVFGLALAEKGSGSLDSGDSSGSLDSSKSGSGDKSKTDDDKSDSSSEDKVSKSDDDKSDDSRNSDKDETRVKVSEDKTKIEYTLKQDGEIVRIKVELKELEDGTIERKIVYRDKLNEEFNVKTKLELKDVIDEETKKEFLSAILSNGEEEVIKVLPDEVLEIISETIKSDDVSIELKEKVHKNVPRVVYNIKSNENGKFLGIFKMKLKVEAEVDPETGEIIYKNKPWWAFLVDEGDDDGGNVDTGLNGSNNNTNNSV